MQMTCYFCLKHIPLTDKSISADITEEAIKNDYNDACFCSFLDNLAAVLGAFLHCRIYVHCWRI